MSREKALKRINEYLAKQEPKKVELALVDDIKSENDKVTKMIGFIRQDIKEVNQAISTIEKIKIDLNKTDKLADSLLNLIKNFERKADDLGIDLPNEVSTATRRAFELRNENDKLRNLIKKF